MTAALHRAGTGTLDVLRLRAEFPILHQQVHGRPLVYLDNGATKQKPRAVIDAVRDYYERDNANIHRGVHELSRRATDAFEAARGKVRAFLNAAEDAEIVFTRGTTEAINLVAFGVAQSLRPGDEVLITHMEHHSNIVPWQLACQRTGATLKVAPITDDGALDLDAFAALLSDHTRMVGVVHQSNSLGTINPVAEVVRLAKSKGALVLIDGAQAVSHLKVDVRALGADFYAFSGHKLYGPTGVGVLYGKKSALEALPPWQGGGDMILSVTFDKTVYNRLPHRLEAGTPNIAGVIGLGAAIDFVQRVGLDAIAAHEDDLLAYGAARLREVTGLRRIGAAPETASILSFVLGEVHPHDVGTILDREGIAVRTGHHCTQPVMARFAVPATVRASLAAYNTREDLDALVHGLHKCLEVFG